MANPIVSIIVGVMCIFTNLRVTSAEDNTMNNQTAVSQRLSCGNGSVGGGESTCQRRTLACNDVLDSRCFNCSWILLSRDQFTIDTNGVLRTSFAATKFPPGSYKLQSLGASVCYPFTQSFLACSKKLMKSSPQTVLSKDCRVLSSRDNNLSYRLGEFLQTVDDCFFVCAEAATDNPDAKSFTWIALKFKMCAYFVSVISLLFAFGIYVKFPSQVKHYKVTNLSHMASLCCGYLMLTIRAIYKETGRDYSKIGCILMATVSQFAFLSAFFWLNVLSIELWRLFRGLKSVLQKPRHRILCILIPSLYAWGSPLAIIGVCLALDSFNVPFRPDYAKGCWISTKLTQLAFFYGPMGILIFINVVLFALTVKNLRKQVKDIAVIASPINKKIYKVTMKLIIVMGVCWIAEVLSWAADNNVEVWLVLDIINGLQGFFYMIIYVLKDDVLRKFSSWLKGWCPCTKRKALSSTVALNLSQRSDNSDISMVEVSK